MFGKTLTVSYCLIATMVAPVESDVTLLLLKGTQWDAIRATDAEHRLQEHPADLSTHVQLIGYYLSHPDLSAKKQIARHTLALIWHHPDSEVHRFNFCWIDPVTDWETYTEGKKIWLAQVEARPESLQRLLHAALYLRQADGRNAEEFLRRGIQLAPQDGVWHLEMGCQYLTYARSVKEKEVRLKWIKGARGELRRSLDLQLDHKNRLRALRHLAFSSASLDDHLDARAVAEQIIRDAEANEDADTSSIVTARLVLACAAVTRGAMDEANENLRAATTTAIVHGYTASVDDIELLRRLNVRALEEALQKFKESTQRRWLKGAASDWPIH